MNKNNKRNIIRLQEASLVVLLSTCVAGPMTARSPDVEVGCHLAGVSRVLFSHDQQEIISFSWDGTIRRWEIGTGKALDTIRLPSGHAEERKIGASDLSGDGKYFAVGGRFKHNEVFLISVASRRIEKTFVGHKNVVNHVQFSPDCNKLITASSDDTARIWDVNTGKPLITLKGHRGNVQCATFSPDGDLCATTSFDGTGAIWRVKNGERVAILSGHSAPLVAAAWSLNGDRIVTGSFDRSLRVWSRGGQLKKTIHNEEFAPISSITFLGDTANILFTQQYSRSRITWGVINLDDERILRLSRRHPNSVLHGSVSPSGELMATSDFEGNIFVWRTDDGMLLTKILAPEKVINSVGWSPNGNSIAWGGTEGDPFEPRRLEKSFNLQRFSMGIAARNDYITARKRNDQVSLFLTSRTSIEAEQNGGATVLIDVSKFHPQNGVQCYSLVSKRLAVIGSHFFLDIVDVTNGRRIRTLRGHQNSVFAVSPSPNEKYVLSGATDYTVRIWSIESGELLVSFFFNHDEWVAWTTLGYYAASERGEQFIGWQVDRPNGKFSHFVPAKQMRKIFHRPDIVKSILAAGSIFEGLKRCGAEYINVNNCVPPLISIKVVKPDKEPNGDFNINVTASIEQIGNYPIKTAHVVLDGKALPGSKQTFKPQLFVTEFEASFSIPVTHDQPHTVAVRADTESNYGVSNTLTIDSNGLTKSP